MSDSIAHEHDHAAVDHSDHDHHHHHHHDHDHDAHGGGGHQHDANGDDHDHDHAHHTGLRGVISSVFAPHSHDSADSVDSALEGSAQGVRAVKISLVALGITALLQVLVVIISGSVALLAD